MYVLQFYCGISTLVFDACGIYAFGEVRARLRHFGFPVSDLVK